MFVELKTEDGIVVKKSILKADIFSVFEKGHENSIKLVKAAVSDTVYREMY